MGSGADARRAPEARLDDAAVEAVLAQGALAPQLGWADGQTERELQFPTLKAFGARLCRQLGLAADAASDEAALAALTEPVHRIRVLEYYLPVFMWCCEQLQVHTTGFIKEHQPASSGSSPRSPLDRAPVPNAPYAAHIHKNVRRQHPDTPAVVIGISAPQGCGKSTIVGQLVQLFAAAGLKAVALSTDDFYKTRAEQAALAQANPGNPLLEFRGNAGSHDLELGAETVKALRACTFKDAEVRCPRYDKSAHGGKGDRAAAAAWESVRGPVDVVLLDGWSLGFQAVEPGAAEAVHPGLGKINELLPQYNEMWDALCDAWIVFQVDDPHCVFDWRLQAEQRMRAAGRPGLSNAEIADFVGRFMPAYEAYLPKLYADGPPGAAGRDPSKVLTIPIDANRAPVKRGR